ncbi:sigma-54-dependent transcriptional regulator [Trichlorobacter ammonificans]|uniref:Regulatory protein AtoC n=1 Tax=Trichlorobacter ammonificans TaxID=2916410 RepID=A0ABM9D6R9_9BACT|nr:sigma-54 dependent transcriptional regulator [Trichlorobacter ammonificans]CAH2030693.1 Regulatory protein AtoC [Trichlorobacter ammonificans]
MKQPRILIIDDEESLRHMLSVMLRRQGYASDTAAGGAEGLEKLGQRVYDFILCDIRMPGTDGREFLRRALEQGVTAPVIMMTAYGTVDTAVACMRDGAYDFISKPFKRDEIVIVLKKAEERERLKEENRRLRSQVQEQCGFHGLVGRSPAMLDLYDRISRVAGLKTTVLIQGESGTGKELVARALHADGDRADRPFVAVNCGALPENLLESELFGHVRGAFTGAVGDKAGLFEQADGGTLFLDEVGEMPPPLQVKLLRVLQEGEVRRVGATTSRSVDVRVVSATSRDLAADCTAGRFREDLFFRLNVFSLALPPLRERLDDLPLLAEQLLQRCAVRIGRSSSSRIAPEVMRRFMSHNWPGNVRELENVIERSLVMCDGDQVTLSCLPALGGPGERHEETEENLSIKRAGQAMEISLIRRALARTGGNRTHAARILEISHRALLYKLKEYGLE